MEATVTRLGELGTRAKTKKKKAPAKRKPAASTARQRPSPAYVFAGDTFIYNVDYDTNGYDAIGFASPTADWIKGELEATQHFDDISVTRNNTSYLIDNKGHIRITLKSRIDRNSLLDIGNDIFSIIKQRAQILSHSTIDFVTQSVSDGKIVDTQGSNASNDNSGGSNNGSRNSNSYSGGNNSGGNGGGSNLLSALGLGALGISSGAVLGLGAAVFLLVAINKH